MVAFLLGASVSGVAWLALGPPGLFAVGFLLSPILGPFLAGIAADKLSAWRYRTRSDLGMSTTFFVFGHFIAGATLIVCISVVLPSAWRSHAVDKDMSDGWFVLVGPFMAVALALAVAPFFYFLSADAYKSQGTEGASSCRQEHGDRA